MPLTRFEMLGKCSRCGLELSMGPYSWLPDHTDQEGELCKNSRYSPSETKYVLNSDSDALRMADLILADTTVCLRTERQNGRMHSLLCGDGAMCAAERAMRARALARYFVEREKAQQPLFLNTV